MSKQPLISVLVTVYNTEQYVGECLTSILTQTYTNWETIVVNDGSTDDSAHVLNEFAAKDSRIHVFHQKNGGAGNAKNNAIRYARGEWLVWLDSDDYIDKTALQEVAALADTDVDIITLGMRPVGNETEIYKRAIKSICWDTMPSQYPDFFKQTFSNCELWLRAMKTSLVKEYDIKNDEGIRFEDIGFYLRLAAVAKQVRHTGKILYNYRVRTGSIVDDIVNNLKDYNVEKLQMLRNCMEWYSQKNVLNKSKDYLPHYFTQIINRYLADATQDERHLAFDFVREMETQYSIKLYEGNTD